MLPRTFNKVRMSMIPKLKSCQSNSSCACSFRMKMLLAKIPVNVIDEAFINFQIREHEDEYIECYNSKMKKKDN